MNLDHIAAALAAKIDRSAAAKDAHLTDQQRDSYIQLAASVVQIQQVRGADDYAAGNHDPQVEEKVASALPALSGDHLPSWLVVRIATWADDAYESSWSDAKREHIAA